MNHRANGPGLPWPPAKAVDDPTGSDDIDRLHVFVPAIMSVGLLFSIATLIGDLLHWTGGRARERRASIEAAVVLESLVDDGEPEPDDIGILARPAYLISAIVLVAGAAYVTIGSTANFLRDQGYVRDIGWLLAVSLILALLLGFLGGVSFAVFRTWPHPPDWTYGPLRSAPLSITPGREGLGPSWALTASLIAAATTTGLLALIVGSGRSVAMDIDRPTAQWFVEAEWIDRLAVIDFFGATIISIGFVALIGLSGFRCRVMAIAFPIAFLFVWIGGEAIRELIERPRPDNLGDLESFPSGHMVQAMFIAGLLPLALTVLWSDRRPAVLSRAVLLSGVVVTAVHRIHRQDHWPLDALAGVTLGLTAVLAVTWVMEHRGLHRSCATCPWSQHPAETPWRLGVFTLSPEATRQVGVLGSLLAIVAAGSLVIATAIVGLPSDPEGFGFGSAISGPVQIALAAVMAAAGLMAYRWKALAAAMMAVAATGLGLFSAVEYRPPIAVGLTAALLVPAVLTWLAWQPQETIGRIATLATATIAMITTTALGSIEIYEYYFGPTHPESAAENLDSEADWLWLGAVDVTSATVVAGGLDNDEPVELRYWAAEAPNSRRLGGAIRRTAGEDGIARFQLADLQPGTRYLYAVEEVGEEPGEATSDGGFTTYVDGPQDLVVVLGSCARVGSNGAVFDAMVAEDPDLYLSLGDLHYANLESTDPVDHIRAYGRALSRPGQAALFGNIPTAYVWDDHDYGPNDSDSSSVARAAVSTAYRRAVPAYGVDPDPDAPIAQAFSVGRVRFVLSDTRSHRTKDTMLGPDQLRWLVDEVINASATHALVVWANPTPWIGAPNADADDWSAYSSERAFIADAFADAGVGNVVMVSGDAHMVAIDDGTNSGYAADGSFGFPVVHAGALDRPGSTKGGPYSHGAFPGGGQYAKLEIDDDGGPTITVRMSGHTWQGEEIVGLDVDVAVPSGAGVGNS